MKYAYTLIYSNGARAFSIQKYEFSREQMLEAFQKVDDQIVDIEFFKSIPRGYHLCGCGNLAKGSKDELCDECKEIYGHTYESEL